MLTKANLNFPSFGPGDLCDVFFQVSNPICLFLYVLLLDMPSRGACGGKRVYASSYHLIQEMSVSGNLARSRSLLPCLSHTNR